MVRAKYLAHGRGHGPLIWNVDDEVVVYYSFTSPHFSIATSMRLVVLDPEALCRLFSFVDFMVSLFTDALVSMPP